MFFLFTRAGGSDLGSRQNRGVDYFPIVLIGPSPANVGMLEVGAMAGDGRQLASVGADGKQEIKDETLKRITK